MRLQTGRLLKNNGWERSLNCQAASLPMAGRYHKDLCGEHGRMEKGSIPLKMIRNGSGRDILSGRALQVLGHVYLQ